MLTRLHTERKAVPILLGRVTLHSCHILTSIRAFFESRLHAGIKRVIILTERSRFANRCR